MQEPLFLGFINPAMTCEPRRMTSNCHGRFKGPIPDTFNGAIGDRAAFDSIITPDQQGHPWLPRIMRSDMDRRIDWVRDDQRTLDPWCEPFRPDRCEDHRQRSCCFEVRMHLGPWASSPRSAPMIEPPAVDVKDTRDVRLMSHPKHTTLACIGPIGRCVDVNEIGGVLIEVDAKRRFRLSPCLQLPQEGACCVTWQHLGDPTLRGMRCEKADDGGHASAGASWSDVEDALHMDDPHLDSERASPPESSPGNRFRGPIGMSEPQGPGQRRTAVVILVVGILQTVFGVLLITPFIRQRWRIGRHLRRFGPPNPPSEDLTSSTITIVVAARGEAKVIAGKLSDLAHHRPSGHRWNLQLITGVGDATIEVASSWLAEHGDCFDAWDLQVLPSEIGKTDSLRRVLPSIEGDLILLTDADARFQSGSIERALRWFADPDVGAIGGTPDRWASEDIHPSVHAKERTHRDLFTLQRLAESSMGSTPFLEGSLLMFRVGAFDPLELYPDVNADDAQIAILTRMGGRRTIQDVGVVFHDSIPRTPAGQRRQKVRRAQGLQRVLRRRRGLWSDRSLGSFSAMMRRHHAMMVRAPWMFLGMGVAMVARWVGMALDPASAPAWAWAMLIAEVGVLASLVASSKGAGGALVSLIGSFVAGMRHLLMAQILLASGRRLHRWVPDASVRDVLHQREA